MSVFANIKRRFDQRKISFRVAFLVCLFGSGSWIAINGIWVELSILVEKSPQQWTLPSYLTVAIALANIGPVLYALGHKYLTINGRKLMREVPVTYSIIVVGIVALLMMSFLWQKTTEINGKDYSTALIALTFFLAVVDCTSSVTFLPYMARLRKEYMSIFYVGEGLSGLIPSLVSLIQGVGKQNYHCNEVFTVENFTIVKNISVHSNSSVASSFILLNVTELRNTSSIVPTYFVTSPRFTVQVFFIIVTVMMCFCLIAFIGLNHLRIAKCERSMSIKADANEANMLPDNPQEHSECLRTGSKTCSTKVCPYNTPELVELANSDNKDSRSSLVSEDVYADCVEDTDHVHTFSLRTIYVLLFTNGVINAFSNGILPSLQSYACLPYGNQIYHLTLTLSAIVNPIACFFFYVVPTESFSKTMLQVIIYLGLASYTIAIAAASPCPLLSGSPAGGVLVLLITVGGVALVSYIKTAISTLLRNQGHKSLVWCGISIQIGSCVGALLMFPIVNIYQLFAQTVPCQKCS